MTPVSDTCVTRSVKADQFRFEADLPLKFLKIRKNSPNVQEIIRELRQLYTDYHRLARPVYRYRLAGITNRCAASGEIILSPGPLKLSGSGLVRRMQRCEAVCLFLLTLGASLDERIQALSREDEVAAYFLNAVAYSLIHQVLGVMKEELSQVCRRAGLTLLPRYAPGYAGWPLEDQRSLYDYLKGEEIGIRINEQFFLAPQHSISGIFGLLREPDQTEGNRDL